MHRLILFTFLALMMPLAPAEVPVIGNVSYDLGIVWETPETKTLVVYTAPSWCDPCKKLIPVLTKLKKEGYDIRIYDIDKQRKQLRYTQVNKQDYKGEPTKWWAVPTLFYTNGGEVVTNEPGFKSFEYITEKLTKL